MTFIVQKNDDIQISIDILKEQGVCIIKSWFSQKEWDDIAKELLNIFDQIPETYEATLENRLKSSPGFPQGKHVRISPSGYRYISSIKNYIMSNHDLNSILDQYYSPNCQRFMQTFCGMENKVVADENLGRHSWIHVDPYAALKFAFFPYGARKETGALKIIPNSRAEGATIRQQFMSQNPTGLNGGIAHRLVDFEKMCSTLVTRKEEESIYLECDPLDLVIIDTDMYHAGGMMEKENHTRISVYIHNRP